MDGATKFLMISLLFSTILLNMKSQGDTNLPPSCKPLQMNKASPIVYKGKPFETFGDTIEYKGGYYRNFPCYMPPIHKRPRSWGKVK